LHDDKLNEAEVLIKEVLNFPLQKDNLALAYMMLGSINARRVSKSWFLGKIKYGAQIRRYLLKAGELAPDLPEAHMTLGSFYLLAPKIIGGDLDKAILELNTAVSLAPDFATACARLAQAYKKKGNLESYNFYLQRAKELDPENEVLYEESGNQRNIP
jgi:tetratricopeptide (TPR) repeat protein